MVGRFGQDITKATVHLSMRSEQLHVPLNLSRC